MSTFKMSQGAEVSPSVSLTGNTFHDQVKIELHGIEINGNLWSRIKAAVMVIWKPGRVVRNTMFVITHNIFEDAHPRLTINDTNPMEPKPGDIVVDVKKRTLDRRLN